jgi:hypothetical protein
LCAWPTDRDDQLATVPEKRNESRRSVGAVMVLVIGDSVSTRFQYSQETGLIIVVIYA